MVCYFSYDTIVAVRTQDNGTFYLHNSWGPTTGKHMNALFSRGYSKEVDEKELDRIIREALVTYGLDYVKDRLDGKETSR